MKDGLALIHKIWSDLKENECCRRVVNEREGERERGEKKGRKRTNVMKCLETEKDERFNILLQLSFYVLKIKSK
jgi:hypothetical protein